MIKGCAYEITYDDFIIKLISNVWFYGVVVSTLDFESKIDIKRLVL